MLEAARRSSRPSGPVVIYPSSGTGAWEAALVNTLSPGDEVLMFETGHFATLWRQMAARWGFEVDFIPGDWRHGADPAAIGEAKLAEDKTHAIKAVMRGPQRDLDRRTSRSRNAQSDRRRRASGPAAGGHDFLAGLGDYRHDEWGVDVTVSGSQKGLMLPPGLGFTAISEKALAASKDEQAAALLLGLAGDAG